MTQRIIAVCNQKGGCGKTTTAVNLSAFLAAGGFRTLLVDLDPQGHASLGLGINIDTQGVTIADVLKENGKNLLDAVEPTAIESLKLVPATPILSGTQVELLNTVGREFILKSQIKHYGQEFDYIIFDCAPSLNVVTINALTAAEEVLIPFQTQYYSLEGMKELMRTIDLVRARLNFELRIMGILPVLHDRVTNLAKEMLAQVREHFGALVFETVIHQNIRLAEAPLFKKPINLYAPESRGAEEYAKLTAEVLERGRSQEAEIQEGHRPVDFQSIS